jgi:pimeloyl-ACP methyl ester carboxylesterase
MKLTNFEDRSLFMKKKFIRIQELDICYRQTGTGPFVFLLHPSPRSNAMMEPLMHLLADCFTVIAWDLPGYGHSSPLPQRADSLYDYTGWLRHFIQHFTHEPITLYGTATGAQLGIAYSLVYGETVRHLYLDNCAHFDDAECERILERYFIDLTPMPDGSHLKMLWQHVCDSCLYFPWYEQDEAHRIAREIPPATTLQAMVNDYLLAGPHYADAYKAAFLHERAAYIQKLKVPATLFKWNGSPLLKYINRLLEHELPENIQVAETPVAMEERYRRMKEIMQY